MINEKTPVGFLNEKSCLVAVWPNRMVPLRHARPVKCLVNGVEQAGEAYLADLDDVTLDQLAKLKTVFPETPDLEILFEVRELTIHEEHFDGVL